MVLTGAQTGKDGRTPTVIVADDHAPTLAMVSRTLQQDGFSVVGEAVDALQAVSLARTRRPDVALLDVRMPGGGIEAAAAISALSPAPAVVMLTVSEEDEDLFSALDAGAVGYLVKGMERGAIPDSLRRVLGGEPALPGPVALRVIDELRRHRRRGSMTAKGATLSNREWEVLGLLADGLSTAVIAERLFVSPVTVRTHVSALVRKLNVRDRYEASELLRAQGRPR